MNTDNTSTMLTEARKTVRSLGQLTETRINSILMAVADALVDNTAHILEANAEDLARMDPASPGYDRLKLTRERIAGIASDMRNVALLPTPRVTLESRTLPNGLQLRKEAVPFGVIGVIYEARPNVTADVFGLCLKSGNACVLKGGHDAETSNRAITGVIRRALRDLGVDENVVTLLPSTREATSTLLHARGLVDLIIPRGSASLIDYVRANATVPVIETGAGVCHCYVDATAEEDMAAAIIHNAKTRRVSVCNALDCAVIHSARLAMLPQIADRLKESGVEIYADDRAYAALSGSYPAGLLHHAADEDYGREFLDYKMSVKTVDDIGQAISHIDMHGSGHSESIVTADDENAARFCREVDAACVYVNAPTSFTDGAQFGLGAEIGISTQKLHARGPMALRELMTYKWIVTGHGQTRP